MATSTAVKERYNKKTYTNWQIKIRKEIFAQIEELREAEGLSRSEFLKMLVNKVYGKEL